MKQAIIVVYLISAMYVGAFGSALGAESSQDADARLLREANIATDTASLVTYLRKHAELDPDLVHLSSLVRELGDQRFARRNQASSKLAALGPVAFSAIRQAETSADKEVSGRARECRRRIEQDEARWDLAAAAVRLLVRRNTAEAIPGLLAQLPYSLDNETQDRIWFGLQSLCANTVSPLVVETLHDPVPIRRALAGCLVGRGGDKKQLAMVRPLLRDENPLVRLRTAQGLLGRGDKDAVPVLIDLLNESSTEVTWQAEELLHWEAGESAPPETIGLGTEDARNRCQTAWRAWWRKQDRVYSASNRRAQRGPGLLLIVWWENSGAKHGSRASLVGCDGKPRWQLRGEEEFDFMELLPDNRVLLASSNSDSSRLFPKYSLRECDKTGKTLWKVALQDRVVTCQRLPGGTMIVATPRVLQQLGVGGASLYSQRTPAYLGRIVSAAWMGNGRIRCVLKDAPKDRFVLATLNASTNLWHKERELLHGQRATAYARISALPGTGFVLAFRHGALSTVSLDGVRVSTPPAPVGSILMTTLPNGHSIFMCDSAHHIAVETDSSGASLWEVPPGRAGTPWQVSPCFNVLRIGFDLTTERNSLR